MPPFKPNVLFALLLAAAACSPRPTAVASPPPGTVTKAASTSLAATAEPATAQPRLTPSAGSLLALSGDTWMTSEPITLDKQTALVIAWKYTGTGPFAVWLVNTAEEVPDPAYDRILIVDAAGASNGSMETRLIPGAYELEVEMADGPWTVDIGEAP